METAALATVLLGAFVQGISGLGFALVAAPLMSQVFPGTAGVGLVVLMGTAQAALVGVRSKAAIRTDVMLRVAPHLLIGTGLGIALGSIATAQARVYIVIVSALLSMLWLAFEQRLQHRVLQSFMPAWGATVNTLAGVGGPPISSYLIRRIHEHESFIRTQQLIFVAVNLAALPTLGIAVPSWQFGVLAVLALAVGTSVGVHWRTRLGQAVGRRIALSAIVVTATTSLVLAVT